MKHKALFLLGPEEGDKAERYQSEKSRILSESPDCEMETFYATDDIEKSLIVSLRQPSLFAPCRLVTVKCMDGLKAGSALIKNITEYLEDPEDDVYLIMFSSDMRSPFPSKVKNLETVMFWEDFESNKRKWISEQFSKEGFYVSADAIDEILQSVENNKAEMKDLIRSISSYYRGKDEGKKKITEQDIADVVSRQKGENGHTLFRQIAERNLEGALLVLEAINLQDPQNLITALMTLTNDFRQAETLQILVTEKRMDLKSAMENATALQTTFPLKKISGLRRNEFQAAIRNYKKNEIRDIIAYLVKNDTEIKSQGGDALSLFETIVYNIVVNGGKESTGELGPSIWPKII